MSPALFLALTLLISLALAPTLVHAQLETQLVALVDKKPYVIEAPYPFLEVSRMLPEQFDQRRRSLQSSGNKLIAWYIPMFSLKEQLVEKTEKNSRYRSLQLQVMKDMEQVAYDEAALAEMRADLLRTTPSLNTIGEDDVETLFGMLDIARIAKQAGSRKILGLAELGAQSFSLCIVMSTEGRDQRGGREIETSVTVVTQLLINGKILLLTVTGPEISAKELRNAMRLTREWVALLRAHNPILAR